MQNEKQPIYKKERVAIFIDGSNFYHSSKESGSPKIDFQKLINLLRKERLLTETLYYNSPLDILFNEESYWKQQKFFEELRKIPGFKIILCRMRKQKDKKGKIKFDVKEDDIYLASDLIGGAYENLYDTAIIVSGDGDFVPAIKRVQKLGKKVENTYFKKTCSDHLRKICNTSLCLDNYMEKIKLNINKKVKPGIA